MDGSIYEYTKGGKKRYRVVYRVEVSTGKLKQRQKRGFTTIKAAKEFLTKVQSQLLNGTYIDPKNIPLTDYLKDWMKTYVEPRLEQSTIDGYKGNIENHIIPCIGHIPLQKLKAVHIQEFYNERLKSGRKDKKKGGLSAKSILYIHLVLSEALKHAVRQQLIPRNPAADLTPPKVKEIPH